MKNLIDLLNEEGIAATPGNTVGMGNPSPAGVNGEIGSEPLPTAKTKKEKRKCKVSEGIFNDDEIIMDANKKIIIEFLDQNYRFSGRISTSHGRRNRGVGLQSIHLNL